MTSQPALKRDLKEENNQVYDIELHRRFVAWKDHGHSLKSIAKMLNRSVAAVSQYINKKFEGNLQYMERDIANLLQREEDLQYVVMSVDRFQSTTVSRQMWEVLQFCDQKFKTGVVLAPSGTGKTETCKEYKRKNRATVFVTADITTRRMGTVLSLLASRIGGVRARNISELLHYIIERMKDSKRLIIIDDAHFLSWEAFEAVRKIHDCANVGIVYVGQERLYEQMRGAQNKAYLFDQIYSRIAIKRDKFRITRKDADVIAKSLCQALDEVSLDYLFNKAKGKGRFRVMTNLLDVAMEAANTNNVPVSVELLQEAAKFLKIDYD